MASSAKIDRWHTRGGFSKNQVVQVRQTVMTDEYSIAIASVDGNVQQRDNVQFTYQNSVLGAGATYVSGTVNENESPTSENNYSWVSIPNFTVSITPRLRGSKFLVMVDLICGSSYWEVQAKLQRNGVDIGIGSGVGSRTGVTMADNNYEYVSGGDYSEYSTYKMMTTILDDPFGGGGYTGTQTGNIRDGNGKGSGQEPLLNPEQSLSYSLMMNTYTTNTLHINKPQYSNNDGDYWGQPISTITVMEISA